MNREQIDKAFREWAASSDIAFGDGKSFAAGWEAALRGLEAGEPVATVIDELDSDEMGPRWYRVIAHEPLKPKQSLYASAPR